MLLDIQGDMEAMQNTKNQIEKLNNIEKENAELKQYCDCLFCKHCDDEFTVEGTNETLCVYCINHKKQNFEPIDKE